MSCSEYPYDAEIRLPRKTGSLIAEELPKDGNRVWRVTTGPAVEPVTLSEFKTFAKIDTDDEDAVLEGFISAVRIATEEYIGRALIRQTIRMLMDYWPDTVVELPRPPLISVDRVFVIDEDDVETVYGSDNYYVVTEATPGKLVLKKSAAIPVNTDRDHGGFGITFKAGYGPDASDVPRAIRIGIALWAAVVYSTRVLDSKNPPPAARSTLDLFRDSDVMIR